MFRIAFLIGFFVVNISDVSICFAAQVKKLKGKFLLIEKSLDEEMAENSIYFLIDEKEKKRGLVKIIHEEDERVKAELLKGSVKIGWTLQLMENKRLPSSENGQKEKNLRGNNSKFNLSFWPVNLLILWNHINFEYAILDKLSLGFTYDALKLSFLVNTEFKAYAIESKYFINNFAFQDSWVLIGSVGLNSSKFSSFTGNSYNETGTYFGLGLSYIWFWDTFNMGLGYRWISSSMPKVHKFASGESVTQDLLAVNSPLLEFSIGWKF